MTDDTGAIQAAIDNAPEGGTVFLPAGDYLITGDPSTPTVPSISLGNLRLSGDGVGPNGTTLLVRTANIGVGIEASWGELRDLRLDGRSPADHVAAIGVLVGPGATNKPRVTRCVAEYFTVAGFALSGTQNALIEDCTANFCLHNYLICNDTRNCIFVNCISSDWERGRTNWMTGSAPDCRQISIGQNLKAVSHYIPQLPDSVRFNTPSNLTFRGGIFERGQRHDYSIHLANGWGRMLFDGIEVSKALTALIRVEPNCWDALSHPQADHGMIEFRSVDANGSGQILSNPGNLNVVLSRGFRASGERVVDEHHRVPAQVGDYGLFRHTLAGPSIFTRGVGGWAPTGSATCEHVGLDDTPPVPPRMKITASGNGTGGQCSAREVASPAINSAGDYGYFGQFVKVRWHCTKLSAGATFKLQARFSGGAFVDDIVTISATGEGEATYQVTEAPPNYNGGLRVARASGQGVVEIEFSYLFHTTY